MAKTIATSTASALPARIVSLDQFRGYTVLGMFLVNFVGSYAAVAAALPLLKHHHTFCSYADTIMPQFLFAVGFAYRMTFLRRCETHGWRSAAAKAWKRNLGLLLVALFVHRLDGQYATWAELREAGGWGVLGTAFERNYFQTLTHIAVTSLWALPVIAARPGWRIVYAVLSAVLFHALSEYGYYTWVMHRPGIDGGPLGFLTWTVPLLVGTLAYDLKRARQFPAMAMLAGGAALMLLAYALSCLNLVSPSNGYGGDSWTAMLVEPPFVPPTQPVNIWTMSQRAGSVSYLTFGAGFSLALYALFVLACDQAGWQLGLFRTLGSNALLGYILHGLVNSALKPFVPKDSPLWFVFAGFAVSLALCYVFLRYLERLNIYLRL